MRKIFVIGGGAAGFFAAIQAASHPNTAVTILEKSGKLLSKVKVSGGGRCNVTHDCERNSALVKHYPRGEKQLKKVFKHFSVKDTIAWFTSRGVQLKIEEDGRMFPVSNSSQTIIKCFLNAAEEHHIEIKQNIEVTDLIYSDINDLITINTSSNLYEADAVIVCTGGHPQPRAYGFLASTGHTIFPPLPSLFTFNLPRHPLKVLAGVSVPNAHITVEGEKLSSEGPLLITHWGFSGPAVLKLSAFGAEHFHNRGYSFSILIRWVADFTEDGLRSLLRGLQQDNPKKMLKNANFAQLPQRLWEQLLQLIDLPQDKILAELSKKEMNRLLEVLFRCPFTVKGKTTFKEEFVTCGGVALDEIDLKTMESRKVPGLYFAGEVLNVDGVTGGFNFQSAWSSGFIAGESAASKKNVENMPD